MIFVNENKCVYGDNSFNNTNTKTRIFSYYENNKLKYRKLYTNSIAPEGFNFNHVSRQVETVFYGYSLAITKEVEMHDYHNYEVKSFGVVPPALHYDEKYIKINNCQPILFYKDNKYLRSKEYLDIIREPKTTEILSVEEGKELLDFKNSIVSLKKVH